MGDIRPVHTWPFEYDPTPLGAGEGRIIPPTSGNKPKSTPPIDAPIPTTAPLYCWSEREGAWMTWTEWLFRTVERTPRDTGRQSGGGVAQVAEQLLFE